MTFIQMRSFLTLAECPSITEAARRLFMTQPALSRQISAIEDELGMQLILRSGSGVTLTPAGMCIKEGFKRLYDEYQELVTSAAAINRAYNGTFTVGVMEMEMINDRMSGIISKMREAQPQLEMNILSCGFRELIDGVMSMQLDVALTNEFDVRQRGYLCYKRFYEIDTKLVVPADHPNASKPNASMADFQDLPVATLVDEETPYLTPLLVESCRQAGFTPQFVPYRNVTDITQHLEVQQCIFGLDTDNYLYYNPRLKFVDVPEIGRGYMVAAWNPNNENPALKRFLDLIG